MSQPLDPQVGSLEATVQALVGLARDRGATPAERELLGGIWAELQVTILGGEDGAGLHERATSFAAELLGADSLLAPANAPYGGFWQELENAVPTLPETGSERRSLTGSPAPIAAETRPPWSTLVARGLTQELPLVEIGLITAALARDLVPGPYLQTMALLPCLVESERARVASGEASWALATGPLVLDLDTATSVAIVGGDGIFELVGGERELLDTRDDTRPLGVVSGGDAGRRVGSSTSLALVRRRLLTLLAFEAVGLLTSFDDEGAGGALALAERAADLVDTDDPSADMFAAAGKLIGADRAWIAAHASGDEARMERARFIRTWETPSTRLRLELGDALLVEEDEWTA